MKTSSLSIKLLLIGAALSYSSSLLAASPLPVSSADSPATIQLDEVMITSNETDGLAVLWFHMAESVGKDGDAAYEDAIELQERLSFENAERAVAMCPTEMTVIRRIAGGWSPECQIDEDGNTVEVTLNGMKVTSVHLSRH